MAVTRRQFITTLGTMAAAVGIGQADLAKVTEAFALGGAWDGSHGDGTKPKVIWVHGAECTGCSTSLLSFFEDATGVAVEGTSITTAFALTAIKGSFPLPTTLQSVFTDGGNGAAINIADVLIDFIDLQYHETVMASGGDGAYGFLASEMASTNAVPFVLVVEGAIQPGDQAGYWNASTASTATPWCSIGVAGGNAKGNAISVGGSPMPELAFPDVVKFLAMRSACAAVIAIGQCAAFGGYPACLGPGLDMPASGNAGKNMTGAMGTAAFLHKYADPTGTTTYSGKVVNSPGCPTNPWWFCLTVVAWLVDAVAITGGGASVLGVLKGGADGLAINPNAVDSEGRLTDVYSNQLHSPYCPRYPKYAAGIFASKPGDDGCLLNLGCKAQWTMSTCGRHGWNNAQPHNATTVNTPVTVNAAGALSAPVGTSKTPLLYTNHNFSNGAELSMGGCCLTAGAPCMGCTEKGYPDAMTPFVVR